MEFRILGSLEVGPSNAPYPLPTGKQKVILAALLLSRNQLISASQLRRYLWHDFPPESAVAALHTHICGLRRRLQSSGGHALAERLETRPGGYLFKVEAGELDLQIFEDRLAEADRALAVGDFSTANGLLKAALALRQGPVLADVRSELIARMDVPRIEEQFLSVAERYAQVSLDLGGKLETVGELRSLVAANPLHEGLRAQLMRALMMSDRATDALAVYQEGRRILVEEIGMEPGEALREMHRQVLHQGEGNEGKDRRRAGESPRSPAGAPPVTMGKAQSPGPAGEVACLPGGGFGGAPSRRVARGRDAHHDQPGRARSAVR